MPFSIFLVKKFQPGSRQGIHPLLRHDDGRPGLPLQLTGYAGPGQDAGVRSPLRVKNIHPDIAPDPEFAVGAFLQEKQVIGREGGAVIGVMAVVGELSAHGIVGIQPAISGGNPENTLFVLYHILDPVGGK